MSDNPLDSIPTFNRLSLRAVLVRPGEDEAAALANAGLHDPVAIPVVVGDTAGIAGAFDIPAVLEFPDQGETSGLSQGRMALGAETLASSQSAQGAEQSSGHGTAMLPPAFGQQALAPVLRRKS